MGVLLYMEEGKIMDIKLISQKIDTSSKERDHFHTEGIGNCWHEYDPDVLISNMKLTGYACKKCGTFISTDNDFTTMDDFMKLFDKK